MATGYDYSPLDVERQEIRLLSIIAKPVRPGVPLAFRLEHASFADGVPEYIAVSYVWGDATQRGDIIVDGKSVSVPMNAEIVLRRLHQAVVTSSIKAMKPRRKALLGRRRLRFWIDSVCANQSDLRERGHQVAIMWRIYSSAKFVLIWLGPDDGTTKLAIKALESIVADMRRETDDFERAQDMLWPLQGGFCYPAVREANLNHLDWPSIEAFYSETWFRRLWVVQETALAKEAYCVRGNYVFPWAKVGHAAQWLTYWAYNDPANLGKTLPGLEASAAIQNCRDDYYDPMYTTLQAGKFQTSEPRDKVFGFLGLLQALDSGIELVQVLMPPDYSAPIDVVYGKAMRLYFKKEASLRVLSDAQFKQYQSGDCDLSWPSWIPKFHSDTGEDKYLSPRPVSEATTGPGTCNGSPLQLAHTSRDPRILTLAGCVMDRVHACAPCLINWTSVDGLKMTIAQSYQFAQRFGCTSEAFFGRIILLDTRADHERKVPSWKEWPLFLQWCTNTDEGNDISAYYEQFLLLNSIDRRLFVTRDGSLGMAHPSIEEGDNVCILFGGKAPYILRPKSDPRDSWSFIGDVYVDGIMDVQSDLLGEYIQQLQDEGRLEAETQWFNLR